MPVNQYVGGAEHAVMHLMYARFFIKALKDLNFVEFDEPFAKLFNQGIVYKDGAKMSKSKGNVVYQTDISDRYGIDTARLFLMFVAAPDKVIEWSDAGVEGAFRFLNKVYSLSEKKIINEIDTLTLSKRHRTIKEVTKNIENFEYNKAIISMMEYANYLYAKEEIPKEALKSLLLLMSPFTPHVAEEMWEMTGEKGFVSCAKWPEFDAGKIDEKAEALEASVEKTVADIRTVLEIIKTEQPKKITLIVSPKWKYGFYKTLKEELEKTRDTKSLLGAIMSHSELKQYGGEITKIIPAVLKDSSRLPPIVLTQEEEKENLEKVKEKIKEKFNADIIVEFSEQSKEGKAKNGIPGKPAIVIQ
jgi:leucyl-tRNA synthetase